MDDFDAQKVLGSCLPHLSLTEGIGLLRRLDTSLPDIPRTQAQWLPMVHRLPWHETQQWPSLDALLWLDSIAPALWWNPLPDDRRLPGHMLVQNMQHALYMATDRGHPITKSGVDLPALLWLIRGIPSLEQSDFDRLLDQAVSTETLPVIEAWNQVFVPDLNTVPWGGTLGGVKSPEVWAWFLEHGGDPCRTVPSSFGARVPLWVNEALHHADEGPCAQWGRRHHPEGVRLLDHLRHEMTFDRLLEQSEPDVKQLVGALNVLDAAYHGPGALQATPPLHRLLEKRPAWIAELPPGLPCYRTAASDGATPWMAMWRHNPDSSKNWPSGLLGALRKRLGPWEPDVHGRGVVTGTDPVDLLHRWQWTRHLNLLDPLQCQRLQASPAAIWGTSQEHQEAWARELLERLRQSTDNNLKFDNFPGMAEIFRLAELHPSPSKVSPALRAVWLVAGATMKASLPAMNRWVEAGPWGLDDAACQWLCIHSPLFAGHRDTWQAVQDKMTLEAECAPASSTASRPKARL